MTSIWKDIIEPWGIPVSLKEINDFEKALGLDLPNDYRDFLLMYNGGKVIIDHEIRVSNFAYDIGVDNIFPLSGKNSFWGIKEDREVQESQKMCMRQAIAICDDGGTGDFYMILQGKEKGAVFYIFSDEIPILSDEEWGSNQIRIPDNMVKVSPNVDTLAKIIIKSRNG